MDCRVSRWEASPSCVSITATQAREERSGESEIESGDGAIMCKLSASLVKRTRAGDVPSAIDAAQLKRGATHGEACVLHLELAADVVVDKARAAMGRKRMHCRMRR